MSGETVTLADGSGTVARLVRAAEAWCATIPPGRAALVGGLAVTARIATMHRATHDIDLVTDDTGAVDANASDHAVTAEVDGVKFDVIATNALPAEAADLPDAADARLFVLAHRWALETATNLTIAVQAAEPVEATVPVASVPALLACKLHAIADRRDARAIKRESDARDIYRLGALIVRSPTVADSFATAPFDLAELAHAGVRRWLIDDAARVARWLASDSRSVTTADIMTLGVVLADELASAVERGRSHP